MENTLNSPNIMLFFPNYGVFVVKSGFEWLMHTLNGHTQCTHSNTHSKGVGFKRKKQAFRKIIRGVDIQINFKIECSETRGFGGWPPCTLSPRFHSYVEDLFYVNISCIKSRRG